MNAMISSKQLTSRTARHARDLHVSRQLRYKHLAFGVGLALGSLLVCGTASAAGAVAADQSPTGGKVVGGTGSISQSGANTVINQQSKLLALDWQTFNVGKDASVLFNQPGASAIALNRILDQNPSQIFGKVTSNGQIFLINTHGIIFGASAQLNVGGLVASTLDLTPQDFLKEHFSLDAHGANAGIVNHGTIAAASGGSVSLVGGQVQNDGLIVADYGHINLDGADKAVLDFDGNGLISVEITGALQKRLNTDQAAVTNSGTLKATSGTVVLQASAAKGLFTDMVNNAGVIKAAGISTAGGVVRLVGSGGNTVNSGSIDVSGTQGGSVQVLSDQNVDVSGSIHADATQNGDGGNILVKGDDSAGISGTLTARGGVQGGNGGFIETSGTHVHIADGTRVNTQAVSGLTGTWLIDPEDFVIGSTVNSDISGATLSANLGNSGSNVTILSSDGTLNPGGNGDIIVLDPVSWSANHTLTLKAARNIEIDNSVAASGAASLTLEAASSGTADPQNPAGTILIDSGGSLSMKGSGTFSLSNVITNNGALIFGLGSNFSYGGVISGGGTLQQSGSKTLKLTGANTYTGATTIDSGATLQLTGTGSIADSSGVDAEGTFDISSTTSGATIKSLSGANTGKVVLGSQTLTLDNALAAIGATNTFAGVISGNGYVALTGGMQAFTGTNTYKGGTSISGGTLQVSSDAGLGDTTTNAAVTINSGGTLQAGGDFTSARTINIANVANVDTNGHAVTLSGDITSGDPTQGSLNKEGAGTLTLTGTGSEYKFTNVNAGTLALKDAGVLGGQFFSVASGAIFDISQLSGAGVTVDSLDGAGTVDLGGKTLTIGSGNTPWTFSGVLADGGIGGGTGGSLVMDDPNVTGILSGTNTYTGNTTIKNGTLSVSADANLGNGGGVILDGGTLENTASFTLNHALSTGTNGGTLQNDTGTDLTVANAITGTGDLTQNGTGTLTVNGNVTTTGANQTYNGTLALGNAVTLTGTTVNLGTVTGNGHDLTVAGNAVLNGVATVPNLNVTGSGNELNFGTGGSVSGNVDAAKLDYDNYGSAVAVNLSGTGTTGVGGNVSGVSSITSLHNLAVTGVSAGALDLATTGAGATTTLGGLTVNGNLGVDSAGAVLQGIAGPLTVTGTTGINAHANAITLDDAGNSLAGVVTLSNSGANAVTVNNGTQALQLGDVHVGTGSLSLTATGITQATGTTITQAAGAGAASFNAGAGVLTLANAGNDLTGMLGLANTGAFDVTFDNGSNALTLGNVNVGTGTLDISATGITQVPGTGIVQAPGAGAASFDANAGALNLNSTLNDLTGIVNLANSGNFAVYLDNGSHALTLGTLNVGSGPLTITDYGVGALLLTQDITTNGGAVDFGGAVTIDGSPTITVDTTGGGAAGANISFGGDVNAAAPNADSLTLTAGNGAVSFGGAVGNTAALNDLTTASKTFTAASTLGIEGDLAITTTGGPISQGGAWTVLGTSDFDAGGNAITLTNASNSFGGLITATGGAVELAGTGTLDMGAVTASSLKLDGASLLHEDITTTGTQNYNGAVTLDGSGNGVALHGNGVAFASTIDNLSSASLQDLSVDSGTGAAQFNGAVGSLNGPLGALVVSGTGQAQFLGNVAAASLTATAPVLLGANITTSGNQTYNGAVALGTNVVATSANGDVSFGSTLDNAAGTPEALTVTAANGATTFGNAVGTLNGPLGNLTSSSGTFSATAALNIGGDLSVSTTAGAIGQSAAWVVAGNSVFNAGNNAVTLTNPNNDFTGTVTVTGAGVSVRDANDLTIGGLTDNNDGDVSLVAGGQLFGVGPINAGTGSITLTAAGAVLTTAALTGGDIALTGGNGISIGDNVNAGGTLTLTANAGSISEGSTAVITAGTLTGSSSGSTHLDGNNQISNIGNFTANGGFSLTNAQSLTVGTGIAIDGGAGGTALKTTSGDLTVNGTVGNAAGATSLTSAGNINEGAGGVVIGTQLTGASIGDTTLTGANKLASVGQFNAVNFTLVNNAALSVVGPLLTSGDISLTTTGGPANVLNVGQALTGGSVTLDSAGDLSITQMVQGSAVDLTANGNLSIDAAVNSGAGATTLTQNGAGSISEGVGGSITAGTLTGTAQGGATLDGANVIANLGDFTAVGFSLTNAADLTVAAGSTVDGGASTSLTTTGAGSDITIDGNVKGTATSLVSSGAINEGASGVVTADTLTGSAANAVQLTGNNAINKLGNFTAASLTLTNGQALTILAGNTVDGGSSAALTIDGDLDLDGTLKGTTTTLGATGAINEGAGGAVVAGTLTGNSGGATDLSGNNAVSSLGNFTADGFALTTNQTLTVNAGATVDGGANTTLTTTGSGHDIGIDGTVQGDLITLVSAGAIGEGSGGLVQGGDLTGSSMGDTALANTQIDDLDAFDAANFALTNAGALTVNGPLSTTGNAGDISLTTTGAGNALTVNQAVQGASITLASAGDLTVADAVTGTQVALAANGNLAIDAAVSSGTGTVTLTQTGSGAITGGANGSITAATLTGSATGTTTLGSASQFMANHVDTLGGFSSPTGFSFTNDGTLTLASVGGSAFTVDAGKSAFYLEVHNGDLLQIGSNWLYDGTGSFSAPDGHIGMQTAPIYVTGVSAQSVPAIGLPPAYFYGVDYNGNLLPFTGSNAVNVPQSILSSKSQGTNGHSDQYIDISVVTAVYRPFGIVPTGLLLPPDQSACSPDQPPSEQCPENN